jgi:hypothetical protein
MSDALPATPTLSDFEGAPVEEAGIEIPGAAGGLRDAMKIAPQEFHKGEKVYVVLECRVGKVRFDPIDKDDLDGPQRRVHIFAVDGATMVDGDLVRSQLADQAERIRLAKESEAGIQRLPYDDEGEHGLAHARGEHAGGLVDGCPVCAAETDAEEAERNEPASIVGRRSRKATS